MMKSNYKDNYKVIVWHQFIAKVRESCNTKNSLTVYKGTYEQCEKFIDIFKDVSYNNWEECKMSKEEQSDYQTKAISSDYNNLLAVSVEMIDKCNEICGSSDEE